MFKRTVLILALLAVSGCASPRKVMKNCSAVQADGNYFVCEKAD